MNNIPDQLLGEVSKFKTAARHDVAVTACLRRGSSMKPAAEIKPNHRVELRHSSLQSILLGSNRLAGNNKKQFLRKASAINRVSVATTVTALRGEAGAVVSTGRVLTAN